MFDSELNNHSAIEEDDGVNIGEIEAKPFKKDPSKTQANQILTETANKESSGMLNQFNSNASIKQSPSNSPIRT